MKGIVVRGEIPKWGISCPVCQGPCSLVDGMIQDHKLPKVPGVSCVASGLLLSSLETDLALAKKGPTPMDSQGNGSSVPFVSNVEAEKSVSNLLRYIGQDPNRDGLKDTPVRVVKALAEMTQGYRQDPTETLGTVFETSNPSYDEIVIVRGISFTSLCEHHLLPFSGTVDVGYLPVNKWDRDRGEIVTSEMPEPVYLVVGLSKLARLVDCLSQRLQIQEGLTSEIAQTIAKVLSPDVAVVVTAIHSCMVCRGVRKPGAEMITSAMLGKFRSEPETRQEFLTLTGRK